MNIIDPPSNFKINGWNIEMTHHPIRAKAVSKHLKIPVAWRRCDNCRINWFTDAYKKQPMYTCIWKYTAIYNGPINLYHGTGDRIRWWIQYDPDEPLLHLRWHLTDSYGLFDRDVARSIYWIFEIQEDKRCLKCIRSICLHGERNGENIENIKKFYGKDTEEIHVPWFAQFESNVKITYNGVYDLHMFDNFNNPNNEQIAKELGLPNDWCIDYNIDKKDCSIYSYICDVYISFFEDLMLGKTT